MKSQAAARPGNREFVLAGLAATVNCGVQLLREPIWEKVCLSSTGHIRGFCVNGVYDHCLFWCSIIFVPVTVIALVVLGILKGGQSTWSYNRLLGMIGGILAIYVSVFGAANTQHSLRVTLSPSAATATEWLVWTLPDEVLPPTALGLCCLWFYCRRRQRLRS